MYGIWCEVNGRMGYRQNWLKRGDGEIAEFLTKQDAEEECERLMARMNGPYRTASFRYSVEEF